MGACAWFRVLIHPACRSNDDARRANRGYAGSLRGVASGHEAAHNEQPLEAMPRWIPTVSASTTPVVDEYRGGMHLFNSARSGHSLEDAESVPTLVEGAGERREDGSLGLPACRRGDQHCMGASPDDLGRLLLQRSQ